MDWIQILAIIFGNAAIFVPLWLHLDNKMHEQAAKTDMILSEIKEEQKDFHGRLCGLEEKYIQMMQRVLDSK